ncbi:MAG: type II secretion system protein [Myxococcota bacterium]
MAGRRWTARQRGPDRPPEESLRARGFTLMELMITISVASIIVPALFILLRGLEGQHRQALFALNGAEAAQVVFAQLRSDLRTRRLTDGPRVELRGGTCNVQYVVVEGTLVRREAGNGCGSDAPVARGIEAFVNVGGGLVELTTQPEPSNKPRIFKAAFPAEGRP